MFVPFFVVNFEVNMDENEELKIGAMISRVNKQKLQAAHDALAELGVDCKPMKSVDIDDAFILFGDDVKVLSEDANGVHVGGHLVRFGSANQPDLSSKRDFFTKETNFGLKDGERKRVPVYFNHAMPLQTEDKKFIVIDDEVGDGEIWVEDTGVLIDAILYNRKEYEKAIAGHIKQMGWSSGTMGHVMQRVPQANGTNWVKRWIIGEGSITPTPAEPRKENNVIPLKSLITPEAAATDNGETKAVPNLQESNNMETKEELKALFDEQKTAISALVKNEAEAAATKAVADVLDKLPEVKAKMNATTQIVEDEADRPFKSVADQMNAMKNLATTGRVDPRMKRIQHLSAQWMTGNEEGVKAILGSNETIPSQGEFLLEPTISKEFLKPIHEDGVISKLARRMPVGPNSVSGWINGIDETARTAGNRWGGVRGYWLSEGDSMTASQPKFKRINWELHQLAVLQYATDNMLRDAALMNSVINQSSMEELNFMVNDAFFRGTGAGQPKGLGTAGTNPALISATRTNATNIDHDDILRMKMRLSPKALARAVWLANPDTMGELDSLTFTSGSTGILSPYVRYDQNGVMQLAGRPVIFNEFSPTLGSVGDLLLVDPDDYLFWEGAGVEGASSIHVQFLTNQTVFRFIYRVDGMPATYSALTPAQGSSTVSPYIGLAATT